MLGFLVPPWVRWAALGGGLVAAFWAGWTVQGWRWAAKQADAAIATLDATHQGWRLANERATRLANERRRTDQTNEADKRALRERVGDLREQLKHANLLTDVERARACPDPRGDEWLRLHRAASAGAAAGAADRSAAGLPGGTP